MLKIILTAIVLTGFAGEMAIAGTDIASGSKVVGCDGVGVCVVGTFNGKKWVVEKEEDDRQKRIPLLTYTGFTPEDRVEVCTGAKCMVRKAGEEDPKISDDDRPYKVPSVFAN